MSTSSGPNPPTPPIPTGSRSRADGISRQGLGLLCLGGLVVTAVLAFGAAQPISGIDISAKKNPGGVSCRQCQCCPKHSIWVGPTNGLPIPNGFFFPGFMASNRWPVAEELMGKGGLPGGNTMVMQRLTEPNFGSLPADDVDARILSLMLTNEAPLVIDATHSYNWSVTIQSTTTGRLRLSDESPTGGRILSSFFDVTYQVRFFPGGTAAPLMLSGTDRLFFAGTPPWSNTFPDGSTPPTGNNFVLGFNATEYVDTRLISQSGIWELTLQTQARPHVEVKRAVVPNMYSLFVGSNYQLQISSSLSSTWTNYGPPILATNIEMLYPACFLVDESDQIFFRFVNQ